jgi:DNA-binding NarL/FixJ family response regulator
VTARKIASKPKLQSAGLATKRPRILVVDDHPIMREGLARVIEETGLFTVYAQAGSTRRALELIEADQPDLVIVDITLPGENGIDLIKDLKLRHPKLPVLVHSMHDEQIYAHRSLSAGGRGYLMKNEPPAKLLQAITQVLAGEIYLSEPMTRQMLHCIADTSSTQGASPVARLSDRELQVFNLIGRGQRTRQIAHELHLSNKTVQTNCDHLKEILRLKDSTSLVRFAVQWAEAQK